MVNTLEHAFAKWISVSIIVIALIAALPAFSADVFVDEGDSDFDTTPIGGPAPASEPAAVPAAVPVAVPAVAQASPDPAADTGSSAPTGGPIEDLSPSGDANPPPISASGVPEVDNSPPPQAAPTRENMVVSKKAAKKAAKKAVKKAAKKAVKKAATKKAAAKKAAKKPASKKSSKKSKIASSGKASKKRGIASGGEYSGGSYQVTRQECAMQAKPGSKTLIGETKADKKLWVEKSGNPNYWKVYSKDGSPAFVKKSCF